MVDTILRWVTWGFLSAVVLMCYLLWHISGDRPRLRAHAFLLLAFANFWGWCTRLALHITDIYDPHAWLEHHWQEVNLPLHLLNLIAFVWLYITLRRMYHRKHNGRREDHG